MQTHPLGHWTAVQPSEKRTSSLKRLLLGSAAAALLVGCNSTVSPDSGTNDPGSIVQDPDTDRYLIVDSSSGGAGSELRITRHSWGRLLDVYAMDGSGTRVLMNEDFLVDPSLVTDNFNYVLETSPVNSQQVLVILYNVDDTSQGGGRSKFYQYLKLAESGIKPIDDTGISGSGLFTMVPRNATIMVQFDDLLDSATLDATTVRMLIGSPSVIPFEARVFMDSNHGDLADHDGKSGLEFYSTRILIDMTVSEMESFETTPPLPVNAIGLPASINTQLSNAQFRIPTRADPILGQDHVLTNPTGHAVATNSNGTIDYTSSTWDLVRSVRAGGTDTNDPSNGFLPDSLPPVVVGEQSCSISGGLPISLNPPPGGDGTLFLLPSVVFESTFCAQTPVPGDILTQPGVFAEVTKPAAPQSGGTASNVEVRLLAWPSLWDSAGLDGPLEWINSAIGPASFLSPFDPATDSATAGCFVTIFPTPPDDNNPTADVAPSSYYTVRFSEPMDPVTVTAFDAYTLTRVSTPIASHEYVVGTVNTSQDVQEFTFIPDLPLAHATAVSEDYFLTLMSASSAAAGSTDLAGNALSQSLPQVTILLDPVAGPQRNGGRVSRFSSDDEEQPIGNSNNGSIPEWAGQISFNFNSVPGAGRETISPRGVSRFQGMADRQNLMISAMGSSAFGPNFVQSPLSNLGSKTQFLWRFLDLGFDLYDVMLTQGANMFNQYFSTFNLDVEGINWSPTEGMILVDNFPGFEIRLSHGLFTPDEVFATTGLVDIYDNNLLDPTGDPPAVVHPKVAGYTLSPGDLYLSDVDVPLMPFPLNRSGDPSTYKYYTYRDTALTTRGGPNGWGMYPQQWHNLMTLGLPYMGCAGTPPPPQQSPWPYYLPDNVQSIALPLLLEFRCWQSPGAQGINRFDTAEAMPGSGPYFRAFSTGGIDQSNNTVVVDPSTEVRANGGFNPGSTPPGAPQPGLDGEVYIGAVDFVVRVSRAISVWFPATDPDDPGGNPFLANFSQYVLEPPIKDQPLGTNITASFRGAGNVLPGTPPIEDALTLDLYGDHYLQTVTDCFPDTLEYPAIQHNDDPLQLNTQVAFYNSDNSWFDDPSSIDGASYYQTRLSFISNTDTGLSPELSAFALTWSQ
ncbi:MAG TPA: hypothetical protein EYQ74_02780 [Planctomycetes bacterium]|nr:hypothetical protein [Planctomycetota bacterium]